MPKKTKAIKITDRKKAWLKKVKPSAYEIETKEMNKIILIVVEGQTEKLYFKSFPVLTLTVEAVDLGGQSNLKLIEETEEILNSTDKDFDKVWCVFDMDVRRGEKEFSNFDNAIQSGKAKGFEIAYSNDAFELWFYLHYNITETRNHRKFYYKALGGYWNCNYEKEGKTFAFCQSIYEKLENDKRASQAKAIERAEYLYQKQKDLVFHKQNPVTMVHELVRYLNKNSRK